MEASRERPARPPPPAVAAAESSDLTNLKNIHDEAYLYVQNGLSCDECGQTEQAVVLYQKGISCIDHALEIAINAEPGPELEKARKMREKMIRTRQQIKGRVDEILRTDPRVISALADPPPSYEVSQTSTGDNTDALFEVLGDSIMSDEVSTESAQNPNALEIFSIPNGAQIYFITNQGFVSAPSYPSKLAIYRLKDEPQGASNVESPPAFLSVGNWTYPLLPGRSPVLHAETGAYLFPDVNSPEEGAAVGVIIPDSVSASERARLEGLLRYLTDLRVATDHGIEEAQDVESMQETRTSTQISKGIVTAAEWISWGLEKGAEKTGQLLKKGSSKLREQISPEAEERCVDDRTKQGVKYARQATNTAVQVSAYIVDGLGKATLALGRQLAPHIRKKGEAYLPKSVTETSKGQSKLDAVAEVAVGGLQGFGTIWLGLEKAGKVLAKSLADETVSVVKHRYGSQVGNTTEDALYTVGNAALVANDARNLGIKAIAKRTVKDAGRAVVEDYQRKKQIKTPSPEKDLLPPTRDPKEPKT